MKLFCTNCGRKEDFKPQHSRCPECGEPLEVELVTKGIIHKERYGFSYLERYRDFYPFLEPEKLFLLGEGNTPLIDCGLVAEKLGFTPATLFLKNESANPTWSFKDRGTVICANFAHKHGYQYIGVVSAGNNAASCGAYASGLGMKTFVFVPDNIPEEKILPITVYGSTVVVKVEGDYSAIYPISKALESKYGVYFANSDVPCRVEGTKSIAFELCEQMNFNPPEWLLIPTGSGGDLRGVEKGFREFKAVGLIDRIPNIVAVQSEGCCPMVKAYEAGNETITHFGSYETIAKGSANPFPPSGNQVLRLIKQRRVNRAVSVKETDILPFQKLMAQAGVFGQPASCMGFAAAKKLLDEGIIKPGERVVALVTSTGLKVTSVLSKEAKYEVYQEKLEKLDELMEKLV